MTRLAEGQERLVEEQRKIWEAIGQTEATLKSFMESTDKRFVSHGIKLDELDAKAIERDATDRLDAYVYERIDPLELLDQRLRSRALAAAYRAGQITREERDQICAADALAVGEDVETGKPACVAVEVSVIANADDVERALLRSNLFLKAVKAAVTNKPEEWQELLPAVPEKACGVVIGQRITDAARWKAEEENVILAKYRNGHGREGW